MNAFKERRILEEMEFNYHLLSPRWPLQVEEEDKADPEHADHPES